MSNKITYRIRTVTYQDGSQRFYPEVHSVWWLWSNISYKITNLDYLESREQALSAIDQHFASQVKSESTEYITKTSTP